MTAHFRNINRTEKVSCNHGDVGKLTRRRHTAIGSYHHVFLAKASETLVHVEGDTLLSAPDLRQSWVIKSVFRFYPQVDKETRNFRRIKK